MLLSGWDLSGPSAAKSLLNDQIHDSVCPQLKTAVSNMAGLTPFLVSRVVVGLLDECRSVLPKQSRRMIRDDLAMWRIGGPKSVTIRLGGSGADFLCDDSLPWDLGMGMGTLFSLEQQMILSDAILQEFVRAHMQFANRSESFRTILVKDESLLRGFGRGLGLCILDGVDLAWLWLDPVVVGLLHPRFRHAAGTMAAVTAAISPTTADELIQVSFGVEDVLGMGGFEIYTDSEWLTLFGCIV